MLKRLSSPIITLVSLAIILIIGTAALTFLLYLEKNVVAIVGSQEITVQEVEKMVEIYKKSFEKLGVSLIGEEGKERLSKIRKLALEKLIEDKLFIERARELNIFITDEQVEKKINVTIKKFPSREEFLKSLTSVGMSEDTYRMTVRTNITKEEVTKREIGEIIVSSEEVRIFYSNKTGKDNLPKEEEVKWESLLKEKIKADREEELIKGLWKKYPPFYGGKWKRIIYKLTGKI